ncbi:NADP-dependent 3-hydroxy acid dehydrogenase YdfG [Kribbella amoyensis]|uniref:NADP-dependent 3-hydroxy acid dehydrogenase YdfG n=1 Tax=Kribbella amoyensis TaxID=996641 RepID=A0A561BRC7_9ACTN|nr:SDR family oxidoreductase [Kribbella amoyensis]TWD81435.1 NADP-dependent 3-hydroxy acid dehydrogenase YdfG [Kribbella amoyensis]
MLLSEKNAIVYGAAGPIGSAVARSFAAAGATVHLAGRTRSRLEKVADEIRAAGGTAETAEVDALDESSVDQHAEQVAASAGSIDVSFNLIGHQQQFGTPLVEQDLATFELPVHTAVRTFYLTTRAAARQMIKQRSGVVLTFGGYGPPAANLGGFQTGFGAVEALRRNFSVELGQYGIRVLTLQTGGIPEAIPDSFDEQTRAAITAAAVRETLLQRAATLDDVGTVAVFAASDQAKALTGTGINLTVGAVPD